MASIALSATRNVIGSRNYACQSASLGEGAVVAHKTDDDDNVTAVSGAAAISLCGVIMDAQPSTGTAVGDRVNVQTDGVALVLLKAGQAVTRGVPLITAGADASVKAWTNETNVDVIGTSLVARTAGSNNDLIPCQMGMYRKT